MCNKYYVHYQGGFIDCDVMKVLKAQEITSNKHVVIFHMKTYPKQVFLYSSLFGAHFTLTLERN